MNWAHAARQGRRRYTAAVVSASSTGGAAAVPVPCHALNVRAWSRQRLAGAPPCRQLLCTRTRPHDHTTTLVRAHPHDANAPDLAHGLAQPPCDLHRVGVHGVLAHSGPVHTLRHLDGVHGHQPAARGRRHRAQNRGEQAHTASVHRTPGRHMCCARHLPTSAVPRPPHTHLSRGSSTNGSRPSSLRPFHNSWCACRPAAAAWSEPSAAQQCPGRALDPSTSRRTRSGFTPLRGCCRRATTSSALAPAGGGPTSLAAPPRSRVRAPPAAHSRWTRAPCGGRRARA